MRRWVVHAPRDADPMDVELYTVLLPAQHGDRRGVMHMIAPADPIVRPGGAHRPARDPVLREGRDSEVASAGGDCR